MVTGSCCKSDCVSATDGVLCSDSKRSFFNALIRPIKPPPRMMKRFMWCSMESATGRVIGPNKMASLADLKRLVNVPGFAIFPLCCVKVCSKWLKQKKAFFEHCFLLNKNPVSLSIKQHVKRARIETRKLFFCGLHQKHQTHLLNKFHRCVHNYFVHFCL